MSENSVLYDVLAERVDALARSFDDNVPYHKFSRRYIRKEKAILKAYLKSKEKQESIDCAYNNIKCGNRIKFAVIVVIAALLLTGFTIYITHYIGNLQINEYDTHSFAFALDSDNAPKTLENRYEITYDLSDWKKTIVEDIDILYFETYRNNDKGINFSYSVKSSYQGVRFNTEGSTIETKALGDKTATFYISPTGTECLIWDNEDCVMEFFYNGISYEQAVEIISTIRRR